MISLYQNKNTPTPYQQLLNRQQISNPLKDSSKNNKKAVFARFTLQAMREALLENTSRVYSRMRVSILAIARHSASKGFSSVGCAARGDAPWDRDCCHCKGNKMLADLPPLTVLQCLPPLSPPTTTLACGSLTGLTTLQAAYGTFCFCLYAIPACGVVSETKTYTAAVHLRASLFLSCKCFLCL